MELAFVQIWLFISLLCSQPGFLSTKPVCLPNTAQLAKTSVASYTGLCVCWGTSQWAAVCYFHSSICLEHISLPCRNPHQVAMVAGPVLFCLFSKIRSHQPLYYKHLQIMHGAKDRHLYKIVYICVYKGRTNMKYVDWVQAIKPQKDINVWKNECTFYKRLQNIPFNI